MRFALYSHDKLVGFTALDIQCVQAFLRQGFLQPVDGGGAVLDAATGVTPALAASIRARRRNDGEVDPALDAAVKAAIEARDALELSLHDEQGRPFDCDFIRICDLRDSSFDLDDIVAEEADDDDYDEELFESGFDAGCEAEQTSWEEREDAFATLLGLADEPPSLVDERWDTERYLIQVFLHRPEGAWRAADRSSR
jgi:hypothetical protein